MISEETRRKGLVQLYTINSARKLKLITLSDWENTFIDNINLTIKEKDLSMQQAISLSQIYRKVT